MFRRADRVAGLVVAAAGVALGVVSYVIDINPQQLTLSARFFPLLLSAALVVLGIALALRPGEARLAETLDSLLIRRGLVVAALLLVYYLTFRHVDFRLGSWAFMILTMWGLGARRPLELVVVPIAVSGGVYAIFRYGFTVLLPTWT